MSAIQQELNAFFKTLQGQDYSLHTVTKGALTQARAKLKWEAFGELTQAGVKAFYEGAPYRVWKGHRLLGVDGSSLNLPSHPSVQEEFGAYQVGCQNTVTRSMARLSLCYDVLNCLTLDAQLSSFSTAEQKLLDKHLQAVQFRSGDVLLLDRNYPSISLLYRLSKMGLHFCLRMRVGWWKQVRLFMQEDCQSKEVVFALPKKQQHLRAQFGAQTDTVRCRLVKVVLDSGETEVLCTSLLDEQRYRIEDLGELYHFRWRVEEAYKLLKCRVGLEVFSGKTALSVRQDVAAKVFMMSMCALFSFPIEEKLRDESKASGRKHARQVNRTSAFAFCKDGWIALWLKQKSSTFFTALDRLLEKTTDIIRANRKFERKHNRKSPPPMNYKQAAP